MRPPSNLPPGVTDKMIEDQQTDGLEPGDSVRLTRRAFAALRRGGTFTADELYDLVRGVLVEAPATPDHVRVAIGAADPAGFKPRVDVWRGYLEPDV